MSDTSSIRVGGIYAMRNADGSWKVQRVLALDEYSVHLLIYDDRFVEPPNDVDLARLNWFIGHIPLAREAFERENRILVKVIPVAEDELDGYRYYVAAMNGEKLAE